MYHELHSPVTIAMQQQFQSLYPNVWRHLSELAKCNSSGTMSSTTSLSYNHGMNCCRPTSNFATDRSGSFLGCQFNSAAWRPLMGHQITITRWSQDTTCGRKPQVKLLSGNLVRVFTVFMCAIETSIMYMMKMITKLRCVPYSHAMDKWAR